MMPGPTLAMAITDILDMDREKDWAPVRANFDTIMPMN